MDQVNPFETQMQEVKEFLRKDNLLNDQRLESEVNWFYGGLGLDSYYFETHSPKEVAGHIISLYSAKCISQTNGTDLELKLQSSQKNRAFYVGRSMPGQRISPCVKLEQTIEEEYLGQGYNISNYRHLAEKKDATTKLYRLQTYRTAGAVSQDSDIHLRLYFLSEPQYKVEKAEATSSNLDDIADAEYIRKLDASKRNTLQGMLDEAVSTLAPVMKVVENPDQNQCQFLILFYQGTTHSFFSSVTDVYHSLSLFSPSKYVEHFSNGMTLIEVNLKPLKSDVQIDENKKKELVDQSYLTFMLPRTSLTPLLRSGALNIWEHAYAYAAWKFAFQFLSRQSIEFNELAKALKNDPVNSALLDRVKSVVRKEAYTEGRILEAMSEYPHIIKELYADFEVYHKPSQTKTSPRFNDELFNKIRKSVHSELDQQIFRAFLTFNQYVVKTNLYKSQKVALSFRMIPKFLEGNYPIVPFAIFLVVGAEFRGYHVRFRDIARGGIRIIRSGNLQAFTQNVTTLFDENYNLAATQDRKNKDIPEGGSKGTILLSPDHQDRSFTAFKKYIDAILDLLLGDKYITDHYGQEEILFMGPDEGTADMMNWASQHSRERGYKFWKAFTTGKSRDRGGIPHDLYGMTTRSIHQYVLGVLRKLNLNEENCTKFQTGGPDGDLGSNEIKISKDKTKAIVDGSGVIYDPEGLNKEELLRCANNRIMVRSFDKSKLSAGGFYVDVDKSDITLPNGTVISSGLDFRNTFHVNPLASADIFVPCGGRPESINIGNVNLLMDKETKKPLFKYIVEGANLFFTQEARLILEKQGVVIFKDASANKGGVTSSSLEVLSALALNDEEFEKHMTVKDGSEPEFYRKYVEEVQRIIESNAQMEFECIWNESLKANAPKAILSDTISFKIVELSSSIAESDLWNNESMRKKVLAEACPKVLLELLGGVDVVLNRVPASYLRAIFSRFLASRYVYKSGLAKNPEFAFFAFVQQFLH